MAVRRGITDAFPTPNSLQVNPLARSEYWKEGPGRGEGDSERGGVFVRKQHPIHTYTCNTGTQRRRARASGGRGEVNHLEPNRVAVFTLTLSQGGLGADEPEFL
jgi:hypothetical protein